jgi:hypothetical protein
LLFGGPRRDRQLTIDLSLPLEVEVAVWIEDPKVPPTIAIRHCFRILSVYVLFRISDVIYAHETPMALFAGTEAELGASDKVLLYVDSGEVKSNEALFGAAGTADATGPPHC